MFYVQPRIYHRKWDAKNSRPVKKKKKRTCQIVDFTVPADHRVKLKENEKRVKYLDLARELKETIENESDGDTSYNWHARYSHQRTGRGTRRLGNKRTSGDYPNYSIIRSGLNSKKSPKDLMELAVTQSLVKDHQLTLMWKTLISR